MFIVKSSYKNLSFICHSKNKDIVIYYSNNDRCRIVCRILNNILICCDDGLAQIDLLLESWL